MSSSNLIENLISFNLTRQEATIYVSFLTRGQMSGYEVAKETGVARSNVYSALQSLVEKGALYLIEGETTKYTPVDVKEFLQNTICDLQKKALFIQENIPQKIESSEGYITIVGAKNIENKIKKMLFETKERVYILAHSNILNKFIIELEKLVKENKKVVIISDWDSRINKINGAICHQSQTEDNQIRLITDSSFVLTGIITGNIHDTCLYSGQQNLVDVMKEALKNKIELLKHNI